jgi:hypothetical protein
MLISAAVRPRNMKRGISDKKLCKALGFKEAVGLHDICGRLELSADRPSDFFFLKELYRAVSPFSSSKSTRILVEVDGNMTAEFNWKNEEL